MMSLGLVILSFLVSTVLLLLLQVFRKSLYSPWSKRFAFHAVSGSTILLALLLELLVLASHDII